MNKFIIKDISYYIKFESFNVLNCCNVESFTQDLNNLRELSILDCSINSLQLPINLKTLSLNNVKGLNGINLKKLSIYNSDIIDLKNLKNLLNLKELSIAQMSNLSCVEFPRNLKKLEILWSNIKVEKLKNLINLRELKITGYTKNLKDLRILDLSDCYDLLEIKNLLKDQNYSYDYNCKNLKIIYVKTNYFNSL